MKKLIAFLIVLVPLALHAQESKLAQKAKLATVGVPFVIAGESGDDAGAVWRHQMNDGCNPSNCNATASQPDITYSGGSGTAAGSIQAERYLGFYDPDPLYGPRVMFSGNVHPSGTGIAFYHHFMVYNIASNTVTDIGNTDPSSLDDTHNSGPQEPIYSVSGNANPGTDTYMNLAPDSSTGAGTGFTINVWKSGSTYKVIQNGNGNASGYIVGSTMTWKGHRLGGIDGAPGVGNDLVLTVTDASQLYNANGHSYNLFTYNTQTHTAYQFQANGPENLALNMAKPVNTIGSSDWTWHPLTAPNISLMSSSRGTMTYVPDWPGYIFWNLQDCQIYGLSLANGSTWVTNAAAYPSGLAFTSGTNQMCGDGTFFVYNPARHSIMFGAGQDASGTPGVHPSHVYELTFDQNDHTASGLHVRKLDDALDEIYVAGGFSLPWCDPVSGHLFVGTTDVNNPTDGLGITILISIMEWDPSQSSGSQVSRNTTLYNNWVSGNFRMGQSNGFPNLPWFNGVSYTPLYDQGLGVFVGESNIYGWIGTANNRAGHETGNGTYTFTEAANAPGVINSAAFNVPSFIKPEYDSSDTGLASAMSAAGYGASQSITFASGSGNAKAIRQAWGGFSGPDQFYSIPTTGIGPDGDTWANLGVLNHMGENDPFLVIPLFGDFTPVNTQEKIIAPNSDHGQTVWIRFSWEAGAGYWTSPPTQPWRKTQFNYQDSRSVEINTAHTANSSQIYVPGITASGSGLYAGCNFTSSAGTCNPAIWVGRALTIFDGSNLDNADVGHYVICSVVDSVTISMCLADGVTPANFVSSNATGVGIAIAGNGILDGVNDAAVDSYKIMILNSTQAEENRGLNGNLVFLNTRPDAIFNRLTNSPNVYQYASGITTNGNTNDGVIPFNPNGENVNVMRIQLTNVDTSATYGPGFTQCIIDWWLNGQYSGTYTHWGNGPGYWGNDDGSANHFKFGWNYLELVNQHTYGDPNQTRTSAFYGFKDLIISTEPMFSDALGASAPTVSGHSTRISVKRGRP